MKKNLLAILILILLASGAWATTTLTTPYSIPKPPLSTTGTADRYGTLMDSAAANIAADVVLAKNIAPGATATGVDTITATYTPAITLTANTRVVLYAAGANTGAATFAPNSLAAKDIKKYVSTALMAGDIPAAGYPCVLIYDGTNWILENPSLVNFGGGYLGLNANAASATTWGAYASITGPTQARAYAFPDSAATMLYSGGALGTPASGALTNCTFPTLNQDTSGTAAGLSGTPGNSQYYGTNSGGTKGFYDLPTGADSAPKYVTYTATATAKDVVYLTAAGTAARAKADAAGTMYAIGFATETKTAAACIIQTAGIITITGKTFTPGLPVYVSAATAGDVTQTPPGTVGNQIQRVGVAVTATDVQIMVGDLGEKGYAPVTVDTFTGTGDLFTTSAASTPDRIAAVAVGQVLISQGTNTKPIWSATLPNMALGTPTSGTLDNCTGTPLISPKAGAMTSGTATVYPGSDGTNTGTKVKHFELTISGNSQTMTFAAPKGTPANGDTVVIDIYTTGSGNVVDLTAYTAIGVTAPTAITASKLTTVGLIYNGQLTAWTLRATGQQS